MRLRWRLGVARTPGLGPGDLYPFEDRWAEIDGNLVHYVDEGEGPPILLLNGNPSWSFGWRDVILGLRGTFRCVAPDYPGFGLSRRPPGTTSGRAHIRGSSRALVDRLGLEGIVVFGYAWGGPIGLGLAGRRPELVRGLVLANTWAWPDDRLRVRLFSALMGGPLSPLLVDRLNLMLRLYLPFNLKRGRLPTAERAAYEGPFPAGQPSIMRVFPREIVRGKRVAARGRGESRQAHRQAGHHHLPDSDPGFGDAELARGRSLFPAARRSSSPGPASSSTRTHPDDVAAALEAWCAAGIDAVRRRASADAAPGARRTRP